MATTTTPRLDLTERGASGLVHVGGYLYEEPLRELQGRKWFAAVREMLENDATCGAILFAVEQLIRGVTWDVPPADESSQAEEVAAHIEQCLFDDMQATWQDTLAEVLTMLPWGFSPLEKCFKYRGGPDTTDPTRKSRFTDGRIGWRTWAPRSQESLWQWEFDPANGAVLGFIQRAAPDYALRTIPIGKLLLFRTTSRKGNPSGRSILRNAWTSFYYKSRLQRLEGIGLERDLAGLPLLKVPGAMLAPNPPADVAAMRAEFERILTNVRQDEQAGVMIPSDVYEGTTLPQYEFSLVSSGGAKQFSTDHIIRRYTENIAGSVLADFLLLGQKATGSYALSSDKTDLFGAALNGWMDAICDVVNRDAIPELVALNGWPAELAPKLEHGTIENPDLAALGGYIESLAKAGIPIPVEARMYALQAAGLPVPADPAALADPVPTPPAAAPGQQPPTEPPAARAAIEHQTMLTALAAQLAQTTERLAGVSTAPPPAPTVVVQPPAQGRTVTRKRLEKDAAGSIIGVVETTEPAQETTPPEGTL